MKIAAQFTREEYDASKRGWGHSPVEFAIKSARRSKVKRLALFHHDPMRTDAQLDDLADQHCNSKDADASEVFFAREGMQVEL
jgi:ribonuclease BN (tRNA processing enzyme)